MSRTLITILFFLFIGVVAGCIHSRAQVSPGDNSSLAGAKPEVPPTTPTPKELKPKRVDVIRYNHFTAMPGRNGDSGIISPGPSGLVQFDPPNAGPASINKKDLETWRRQNAGTK